jgi:choloylglycine hydrolase
MMKHLIRLLLTAVTITLFVNPSALACSTFRTAAQDGTLICARTMEFGLDTHTRIVVVPRGWAFSSPAPNGATGLTWKALHGFVACNALGLETSAVDGLNEKGLAFSALWYENDMRWPQVAPGKESLALAHTDIGSWILSNFATVDEVKTALANIQLFGYVLPQLGGAVPLHFIVYDANGGCIVIECDNGEVQVYDNKLALMTNAPKFPWMLENLRNYVGLTNQRTAAAEICGIHFNGTGHGDGMFGLPGDITPPSRFVRMAITKQFATPQPDALTALNQAQHIANSLDIVLGMVVDKDASGRVVSSESTEWTTFYDLTHKVMYFKTYDNLNLRKIDLEQLDFNASQLRFIPMDAAPEIITDVTSTAK